MTLLLSKNNNFYKKTIQKHINILKILRFHGS